MEPENYFETLNELVARLKGLDERGLVLTLAAFAEDSLAELLKAFMFENSATKKLIEGYDAPLGIFSARTRAAYSLGLVTKGQYHDLEHLRAIRNAFAHTWRPISLEDSEVRAHVRAIHYSNLVEDYPETSREKLEGSLSFLLVELKIAVSRVAAQKTKRDILGSRLYAGPPGSGIEQFNHCVERLEAIANDLEAAESDRKEFFKHLRRCWVEKSMRAITKTPKDQWNTYIMILQQYTSPDELKSDAIFNSEL